MRSSSALIRASLLLAVCLFSACSMGTETEHEGTIEYRSLVVNGEERTFVLYLPKGVKPSGAGLILAFHGWGMTGIGFQRGSDMDRVAREIGAVIAYPDASGSHWAEDCGCVSKDATHLEADTIFVSEMMEGLTREFGLDPRRRFAVGASQGGLFTMRLACQMSERFEAVVAVTATMAGTLAERCEPNDAVDLLTILSQRDESFAWEGYEGGGYSLLGAEATAAFWAGKNGCSPDPQRSDDGGVLRLSYSGCAGGGRVDLVAPDDGEHSWTISPKVNTRREVVDFLSG